jgi:hypothetical protein
MVHFRLNKVYYDGAQRLVEDRLLVSVTKTGGIMVRPVQQRVIRPKIATDAADPEANKTEK